MQWCFCLHRCLYEGGRFPETGVVDSFELSYASWELNPGPLSSEKLVILAAEPSVQPLNFMFYVVIFHYKGESLNSLWKIFFKHKDVFSFWLHILFETTVCNVVCYLFIVFRSRVENSYRVVELLLVICVLYRHFAFCVYFLTFASTFSLCLHLQNSIKILSQNVSIDLTLQASSSA